MMLFGILVAGFAGGWMVRSSVNSSRTVAVAGVSAFYSAVERGRRVLAIEREHLEDLMAEGRVRYETARLRAVQSHQAAANDAHRIRDAHDTHDASEADVTKRGDVKTGRAA
jgi:hypothetical protein